MNNIEDIQPTTSTASSMYIIDNENDRKESERRSRSSSINKILEDVSSIILDKNAERGSINTINSLPTSRQGNRNDNHFYSQFNEESFINDYYKTPHVYISGGVPIPSKDELIHLLKGETYIKIMCLTWNINGKSFTSILTINDLFKKIPKNERPEIFAIALQELPSTLRFHREIVNGIHEGIKDTHQTFCWVRKWSQLLIIFMKKHLCLYTSRPEYQFVSSSKLAKPFRTKGAIGICFRILQSSFVFISCHFSHGKLQNRIIDYKKAATLFNFKNTLKRNSTLRENHTIFNANAVFWFGDLNFRLMDNLNIDEISEKYNQKLFINRNDYELLFTVDELRQCMNDELVFNGFKESNILFPPTYKFIPGTFKYAKHRIPSYTDRILYRSLKDDDIKSINYDTVWPITVSDHKPVYGNYHVNVLKSKYFTSKKPDIFSISNTGEE